NDFLYGVAALATNNVWAVGAHYESNGPVHTLVERWDGSAWNVVPSPDAGATWNYLYGVSVLSTYDIWAVGRSWTNGQPYRSLTEHYLPGPCATPSSTATITASPTATHT